MALFGPERYATLMGRLAFPSLIVQALAPSATALLIERSGVDKALFKLAALLETLVPLLPKIRLSRIDAHQPVPVSLVLDLGNSRSTALLVEGRDAGVFGVPLEMRVACERCQAPLGHEDLAFICSYECTFCAPCAIGQAQVPMTLLMALATPWAIAFATNLKLFPALLAVWWLGRREWRPPQRVGEEQVARQVSRAFGRRPIEGFTPAASRQCDRGNPRHFHPDAHSMWVALPGT